MTMNFKPLNHRDQVLIFRVELEVVTSYRSIVALRYKQERLRVSETLSIVTTTTKL